MRTKLSKIEKENFSDEEIDKIVYSDITDTGKSTKYGIVFGNSMLINERVNMAVKAYDMKRIEKVIFTGGVNGVSNQDSEVAEAIRMRDLACDLGIPKEDIIVEDKSNNTFENVQNSFLLIPEDVSEITIITSEFHLKRVMAIIKKLKKIDVNMIVCNDGYTDRDNWFLSDNSWNTGRSIATYEAKLLVKYAKEDKIADLEVDL